MNILEKQIVLATVNEACEKDPSIVRDIIGAATAGVQQFADKQSDIGTKAVFKLICVLEQIDVPASGKFGPFTFAEVLDSLEGCFGGTPALAKLRDKFKV